MFDVIIVGGGAAGFYAAIHIAETNPAFKIAILERGKEVLTKVKVSGGGRCNVTHAEFDPNELVKNYPRGEKELRGPFHTYCSGDTIAFFDKRGITLKIEEDGRMFPESNTSQTIVDCFTSEAERLGIKLLRNSSVVAIETVQESEESPLEGWMITSIQKKYYAKKLLVTTGSNPKIWKLLEKLGHTIVPPVPSLFTFNIKDNRIDGIPGVSTYASVEVLEKTLPSKVTIHLKTKVASKALLVSDGPLLITHWGMSGPAILKLSAWGARMLNDWNYRFKIKVNWLPDYEEEGMLQLLLQIKGVEAKKTVLRTNAVAIPKRLWVNLVKASDISEEVKWADVTKVQLQQLAKELTAGEYHVDGKSTFKEEFVTAGGVDLKEINFKTYESKIVANLFFAGEVINVDAITGGFNFQNAWTSGYISAQAIAAKE
ncbi:NAD(P)/FAD-dependent oxidoreductase [Cellulophaga sp. HaHa_2_95]|uniref:NAD(P)/FAD-dependent oxidoreductase n=1 Tax=Cellulophaga sp. HaHa_2_95 TaxID=2745558 RepID=UPI001C4FB048|nr:NAD(P)/FAD-dependent oxidoreductase [Cellulophaga sp. HaHa_2_95]QXP57044.1 NAD(P)/FAD-dependent oxidoreductase [Cellulophaga sp. HaHa_2_95]